MNIVNEDVINEIISSNDPKAVTTLLKWTVNNDVVKAGNNFTSEVSRLTIEYNRNGEKEKIHVFLKVPSNPMAKQLDIYRKESIMYTQIIPQLLAIDNERFSPKCYYVDEEQSVFLDDLSERGYRTVNRNDQLDFEHCSEALKRLAKFHALSVKLERDEGISEFVRKDLLTAEEHREGIFVTSFLSGIKKFHENLHPDIQRKYSKEIEFFNDGNVYHLAEDVDPLGSSFNVLTHGDFWTNNIMFKYDEYGIIQKVKMIDFQGSRWTNPALDLIYFAMNSMRFDVFEQYFDLLLVIYVDTLNKILKKFDCQTYTVEGIKNDIDKRYRYAYMVLTCFLPFTLRDSDDVIDKTEVFESGKNNFSAVHESFKQKHCMEIATKWFLHWAQKKRDGGFN